MDEHVNPASGATPDAFLPVEWIPGDERAVPPQTGIGLCLSGGGYRAMLFHAGALWRLNQFGYLPRLNRVSSVSGGSITAGMLGLAWSKLGFDRQDISPNFVTEVIEPLRELAGQTIDVWSILRGLFGPGTINARLIAAYRARLFGTSTLQDLPSDQDGPRFVLNAANLQSGALWRFSRPYAADWRVGVIPAPDIEIATAVAASSAFPPFLSPAVLRFAESDYEPDSGKDLQREPFTTSVTLSDGGVYDNLGLETVWKRYKTVLVSNGGGEAEPAPRPKHDWLRGSRRIIDVVNQQVRNLRVQQLIASYNLPEHESGHRMGAYWGIRSEIHKYSAPGTLTCPPEQTLKLARISTRLARMNTTTQMRLINWGYAICDAAMRTYVDASLPAPEEFPYRDAGVG